MWINVAKHNFFWKLFFLNISLKLPKKYPKKVACNWSPYHQWATKFCWLCEKMWLLSTKCSNIPILSHIVKNCGISGELIHFLPFNHNISHSVIKLTTGDWLLLQVLKLLWPSHHYFLNMWKYVAIYPPFLRWMLIKILVEWALFMVSSRV